MGIEEFTVRLRDERHLSAAVYGNARNKPIIFFHGFGTSKSCIHPNLDILEENSVSVISIDRPGIGGSDIKENYTAEDFAWDVHELADYRSLDRFALCAWSSGGLYGQVFASMFPERLVSLSLVSSAVPLNNRETRSLLSPNWKNIFFLNTYLPPLARAFFRQQYKGIRNNFESVLARSIQQTGEPEKAVLMNAEIRKMLVKATEEAYINEERGLYYDAKALCRPLTPDYSRAGFPVYLWHGTEDWTWSVKTSEYLHGKYVSSNLERVEDEGHFLIFSCWDRIIARIARDY